MPLAQMVGEQAAIVAGLSDTQMALMQMGLVSCLLVFAISELNSVAAACSLTLCCQERLRQAPCSSTETQWQLSNSWRERIPSLRS